MIIPTFIIYVFMQWTTANVALSANLQTQAQKNVQNLDYDLKHANSALVRVGAPRGLFPADCSTRTAPRGSAPHGPLHAGVRRLVLY